MYFTFKKAALIGSLIGFVILLALVIHNYYNKAVYTANLDSRPFTVGVVGAIRSLEPAKLSSHEERLVASAMYEGLVYYDETSESVKPLLAKSWKYSADGKSLTVKLKNNVKFYNGKGLTAHDVKASWEKNFSTAEEQASLNLFFSIEGSNERLYGKSSEISGIQVIDNDTIKIKFSKSNAAFIYMLTNPIFWIFDCEDKAVPAPGTGPYILKENKDNKELLLVRNDKYHQGVPRLTAIDVTVFNDEYQAFGDYKTGKLDYLDRVPLKEIKNIKNSDKYKKLYIEKPVLDTYAIGFNFNKEPFAGNYLLRRALNYAIDRNAIIEEIMGGAYWPSKGVIPIGVAGYNREMPGYTYDPEKAKELLKEAGYSMGVGLAPLVISYNEDEGHRLVLESVSQQLAQLGVQVQLQPMDWDYFKKQLAKTDLSCFRLEWFADYPDADSFLYSLFHSSQAGVSNFFGYLNPQVDKILEASREEIRSQQERLKLMNRAEEIIVDDAPCLWLFQKRTNILIGDRVNSFNVNCMRLIDWYRVELLKPSAEEKAGVSDTKTDEI
ncbi:MAG: ABC transporter substrate-binding protein [Syntrophomonadaceae bacterium]|nr:ABC transporter substrate-binding protein [Syntrophomonadaceae bacterium]